MPVARSTWDSEMSLLMAKVRIIYWVELSEYFTRELIECGTIPTNSSR